MRSQQVDLLPERPGAVFLVVRLPTPQPRTRRGAMLVAGFYEQRFNARQVAHEAGRDAEVAIACWHPGHIEVHRPKQDRMSSDQRQ